MPAAEADKKELWLATGSGRERAENRSSAAWERTANAECKQRQPQKAFRILIEMWFVLSPRLFALAALCTAFAVAVSPAAQENWSLIVILYVQIEVLYNYCSLCMDVIVEKNL